LITDGGLLDTSRAVRLKELGVGPVQPTLLSGHPTVHDELKGTASFLATVAAIGRLMKVEVPVCVSFVCTRVNYQCFREVLELCFALGVRSVAFSRFCTAGRGAEQAADLTPTPHQIGTCLDIAEEARRALGMKIHMAISLPLCIASPDARPHLAFGRCALGTSSPGFTIDPMGHLRACSVSPVILGDLRRESWTEILDRAQLGYFQDVTRVPDACRGCELLVRCGGGCRESARGVCGDPGLPDPLARPGIRV
jgi:radical SAM protein with 4Fe4S-binding SPASM domain